MLVSERHAIILEELERKPSVSIRDLTKKLDVSRETVRKDIEKLAEERKVQQVRGGVMKIRTKEVPVASRLEINSAGKASIAKYLASQIPDATSVFLDNGSSVLAVAQALLNHKDLIVYTNDLRVAEVVAPICAELVLIGGRVDLEELAVFGTEALENLARYRAEYAIVSAGGLSSEAFLTDFNRDASSLRHQMLLQAQKPTILADASKFGVVGHVVFPALPEATQIISDSNPDEELSAAIKQKGCNLTIAP